MGKLFIFKSAPLHDKKLFDDKIEKVMNNIINVIELGRKLRNVEKISLKKPVVKLIIINTQDIFNYLKIVVKYIIIKINVNELEYNQEEKSLLN